MDELVVNGLTRNSPYKWRDPEYSTFIAVSSKTPSYEISTEINIFYHSLQENCSRIFPNSFLI